MTVLSVITDQKSRVLLEALGAVLSLPGEDSDFLGGERLSGWGAEGHAAHEAGARGPWVVGGEGEEGVVSLAPSAGGAVLDPEQRARQIRQPIGEVLEDDLRREL